VQERSLVRDRARSFHRDQQVLEFVMTDDEKGACPPRVVISQADIERRPEVTGERITQHLDWLGGTDAQWEMVPSGPCSARALALDEFRHGSVLFVGDDDEARLAFLAKAVLQLDISHPEPAALQEALGLAAQQR